MRKLVAIIALAGTLVLGFTPSTAQATTDQTCDYGRVIVGCQRAVFEVQALPDGAEINTAVVRGNIAACSYVGFDQLWCVVSDTPAVSVDFGPKDSNPCTTGTLIDDARLGVICADTRPLIRQPISFTG